MHIQRLAPVILGDPAWAIMQGKIFTDWQDFRNTVDARYGLTKRQCLAAFFDMRPSANESTASFLRRVEDMRVRYGVDEEETRRHFVRKLREADLQRLDDLSDMCALMGNGSELEWHQLVKLADHQTTHTPLSANRASWSVVGFDPPSVAAPPPGVVAAQPRATPIMVDSGCHTVEGGQYVSRPACELCIAAGRAQFAHTHTQADCFLNPRGSKYRHAMAVQRL